MTKKPNGKPPKSNGKGELGGKGGEKTSKVEAIPDDQGGKKDLCPEFLSAQWKPGQSGNPKGRPKKPSLWDAVARKLRDAEGLAADGTERVDAESGEQLRPPTIDEVAEGLLAMVMSGNPTAAAMLREMGDRLDGRVPIRAELTGKDGDPIEIRSARDDLLGRIDSQVERIRAREGTREPN